MTMTISISPELQAARECLQSPDIIWGGGSEDGVWGQVTAYNRDSSAATKAVVETIYEEIHEQFPDDVRWCSGSHWGFGWYRGIEVRVVKPESEAEDRHDLDDDDLTEAFLFAHRIGTEECRYDSVRSEAEYEATLENIGREFAMPKDAPFVPRHDDDTPEAQMFTWLFNNSIEPGGDDNTWFSPNEVKIAALFCGFHDWRWDDDPEEYEFVALVEEFCMEEEFSKLCSDIQRWLSPTPELFG